MHVRVAAVRRWEEHGGTDDHDVLMTLMGRGLCKG